MPDRQRNPAVRGLRRFAAIPARCAAALIRIYQRYISPFLGPRCRFYPTCSTYAGEAIRRFGMVRGGWLALSRLLRCNPWCDGGVDPVPSAFSWRRQNTDARK